MLRRATSRVNEALALPTFLPQPLASLATAYGAVKERSAACELRSPLARSFSSERTLQFCVVGSGPAGFYSVSQLLKTFGERVHVSILERLPTPFGLVRSGVAPDHPDTKNVIHQFTQLGSDSRVSFFGNVRAGTDVLLPELRAMYDGVVLAYGAESNRVLEIPGRHLDGIFPAREFVWWYNGHPDYRRLPMQLRHVKRVAILGLGNVALDCARILLQPPERLSSTDIAQHALRELSCSGVEQVDVIGRRGIAQAAFTAKELREILNMDGITVELAEGGLQLTEADKAEMKASRARKRVVELLTSAATPQRSTGKRLRLHFLQNPVEAIAGDLGRVSGLRLERTKLQKAVKGRQAAVATGSFETLSADLVLESIGYRSVPLGGAPFDEQSGIIPNRQGRVVTEAGQGASLIAGLYVCGWVKRGPSGIIGTNLVDASETVQAVATDVEQGKIGLGEMPAASVGLQETLRQRGAKVVDFDGWLKIDAAERLAGEANGCPRLKFTDVQEMLNACM